MSTEIKTEMIRGGQFIVKETNPSDIFTPEDFLMSKR